MNVSEAIKQRYSCRAYKAEEVAREKLLKILEAARLAPSAHNGQNWKFVVVEDLSKRQQLAQAAGQEFIAQAPVIIAAVALRPNDIMSCGVPSYAVDLAIAVDHMTLQATEEMLATCWIGAFKQDEVKKILDVPADYKVVVLLPLGYPADSPRPKHRKELKEIVCFDLFE